jgi:hypothetical protein
MWRTCEQRDDILDQLWTGRIFFADDQRRQLARNKPDPV